MLPTGLDGILIINARHLVQRREHVMVQLDALGLSYEFIHEYDAVDVTEALVDRYFPKLKTLLRSQMSCALKHLRAHEIVVERGWKNALILEDDVVLAPNFLLGLNDALKDGAELTAAPKVIFLGHGGNYYTPKSRRRPGQKLYIATKGRFGDAYIIDYETAVRRSGWMHENGINKTTDNLFDMIDGQLGIELYWFEEPIVEQGSKNGLFSSTLDPLPPKLIQKMLFNLEKLRRKYIYQLWR